VGSYCDHAIKKRRRRKRIGRLKWKESRKEHYAVHEDLGNILDGEGGLADSSRAKEDNLVFQHLLRGGRKREKN